MEEDRIVTKGKSVTVVVSRRVQPGNEQDYDEWVRRLLAAATQAPGNIGATMLIPEPGQVGLFHVVLRFADEKSVHRWETSYIRQKLSREADAFSTRSRQESTGLETWVSLSEFPELIPPRWEMATVTFMAVYVLSLIIVSLIQWLLGGLSYFLESALIAVLLVVILAWLVMPLLSQRVFRKWLYK